VYDYIGKAVSVKIYIYIRKEKKCGESPNNTETHTLTYAPFLEQGMTLIKPKGT
jgi:hypothetical protein